MELITLATSALALASPYIAKTGEKLAEEIGVSIWDIIKKPFVSSEEVKLIENADLATYEEIRTELIKKLAEDPEFKNKLENQVTSANVQLSNPSLNIVNQMEVQKQINIQSNNGPITM